MKPKYALTIVCLFAIFTLTSAYAQDNWLGGTSYWSNGSYWSTGFPPQSTDLVTIYSGGSDLVVLNVGSATIGALTLGGNYNGFSSELTDAGTPQNLTMGELVVGQSGFLDLSGGGTLTLYFGLFNSGFVQTSAGITNPGIGYPGLTISNSGTMNNFGSMDLAYDGSAYNSGTWNNFGAVFGQGSLGFGNAGMLNNYGSIGFLDGSVYNSGTMNNYGSVSTGFYEGLARVSNDGVLNNFGYVSSGGDMGNTGTWNNEGTLDVYGTFTYNSGTFDNSGTFNNYGALVNEGVLTNSGVLNMASAGLYNDGTLRNYSVINNDGGIFNAGTFLIAPGAVLTMGGFGYYYQSAGSTVVDGVLSSTFNEIDGGTLSGSGVIKGDVFMGGTMSPGDSPGRLTIQGNYTQFSTGTFFAELAGLAPGTQYDQLVVSGLATLDGTLDVVLLNGFIVKLGDNFVLMTFGSETGQFSVLDLPTLTAGEMWRLSYNATDLTLSAVPSPEPATFLLLGSGLLGVVGIFRRKIGL